MKSFFEWFREARIDRARPWLILGKGPSFSKHAEFDLRGFHLLSLNDAARELPVDVAHAIDLHAIERSGEAIAANAQVLVMPWHPHIDFKPAGETLEELAQRVPVLRRLAEERRLLWYNHSKTLDHRPGSPVVSVRYFSAEGALNLLAAAGVRSVRSLGIDGGTQYGASFQDLSYRLLANRQPDFERQFSEFAQTILRSGIDFAPLDADSPIRIFVGAEDHQLLAARVLEYSIKKRTSMTTSVVVIGQRPFALQRFPVPQLMNRSGRALYLDCNMQAFRDLRLLWATPTAGADIDAAWDCPDRFEEGVTGLLRYAAAERQPWISLAHELGALWVADLIEAVELGFISLELVEQQVASGHVRPSLLWQVAHRAADPRTVPDAERACDAALDRRLRIAGGP